MRGLLKSGRTSEFITKIKNAENIYFLGFGFDRTNLQNLGFFDDDVRNHFISNCRQQNPKKIFVTNYVGEIEVKPQGGGGLSSGNRTSVVIDKRRFSNNIILTLEEVFDCKIQIARDGFFSQGYNALSILYPIKLYISELGVGRAVREDFTF